MKSIKGSMDKYVSVSIKDDDNSKMQLDFESGVAEVQNVN